MVFGWGKKKQIVEEKTETPVEPVIKEIPIQNISEVRHDVTNLRQKTLIAEMKSFQKTIESGRKTLLGIADELGKDSLSTDDMDPHLVILVNRGKKEVISSIQNEFRSQFSDIDSFEKVMDFQRTASRGIKKVGDMLGKHSRVIHIFAKKYAKKLKSDLEILSDNLTEVNTLIANYNSNQELLDDINETVNEFSNTQKEIEKQIRRKSQLEELFNTEQQNLTELDKEVKQLKSSSEYEQFLEIKEKINETSNLEKSTKKNIEEQFIKISRPLNKYVYISSLDKPLKIMAEELAASPYDVISQINESNIITILNSVQSGIVSGAVSVKDIEKSKQAINDIQSSLSDFIKQKSAFVEKKSQLGENLTVFDNEKLHILEGNLVKSKFNISDIESKLVSIEKQIDRNQISVHDIVSKLEVNLKQASGIPYKISLTEIDLQN